MFNTLKIFKIVRKYNIEAIFVHHENADYIIEAALASFFGKKKMVSDTSTSTEEDSI